MANGGVEQRHGDDACTERAAQHEDRRCPDAIGGEAGSGEPDRLERGRAQHVDAVDAAQEIARHQYLSATR